MKRLKKGKEEDKKGEKLNSSKYIQLYLNREFLDSRSASSVQTECSRQKPDVWRWDEGCEEDSQTVMLWCKHCKHTSHVSRLAPSAPHSWHMNIHTCEHRMPYLIAACGRSVRLWCGLRSSFLLIFSPNWCKYITVIRQEPRVGLVKWQVLTYLGGDSE